MKKNYMINLKKSDGTFVQKGILSADTATNPAIVNAISAAIAANPGAEVVNINLQGQVDIDATEATGK